jgi:hypothetical protein
VSRKTTLRHFADDSLLYRSIKTIDDRKQLQEDLATLTKWAETWQMTFHPAKCYILRVSRKNTPIIENYEMKGHILSTVHQCPYLGVELSEDLGWEPHINKANKVLGFLRRNIGKCPQDIKEKAYLTLVRPHLEYSSAVWDPHRKQHINSIEMIQRRAARFATSTYSREQGMVTSILNTLGWHSLQSRRKTSRLTLMIKLPLTFHLTSEDPPYLHGNITLTNSPRSVFLQMHTSSASYHEP